MIKVFANAEELSRGAAEFFALQAKQAHAARGRFSVALSGGHTPERTYRLLSDPALREQVAWKHMHVFWGDERCVPADDPQSNQRLARETLLDRVPLPAAQIHPISCDHSAAEAAARYETLLRSFFPDQPPYLDLVLLGLGENGHTASLFPDTAVLDEQQRWVAGLHVAGQDFERVTLTAPFINRAATVLFLVTGASKATVLQQVIQGPAAPRDLPAQLIRPLSGKLHWFIDQDANAQLQHRI